ncbi:MAG: hypothetical protein MUE81_23540 [Thermoflexibacter sp.]|jgi:hypothetical protein|nr:hypothetical protein [Thermoflexibacter sp.]
MNIDKIFKNKLSNHQIQPSGEVWNRLEEAMYGKQIKRRNLVAYWKVAAAVVLLLSASYFYFQEDKNQAIDNHIAKIQTTPTKEDGKVDFSTNSLSQPAQIPTKLAEKEAITGKIIKKSHQISKESPHKEDISKQEEPMMVIQQKNVIDTSEPLPTIETEQTLANQETAIAHLENQNTEESFSIVVKIEEETSEEQDKDTPKEKKSWIRKMVSNMKKNREKEKVESAEGKPEKAKISIFGINTDKIFAKKQHQSEKQAGE